MKQVVLLLVVLLHVKVFAQQIKIISKDSLPLKTAIKNNAVNKRNAGSLSLEDTIKAELDKIVTAYISQPNTAATWAQIKGTAEGFLYTYFLNGKLMGTKKEQAFYVKMGTETMTAADVANKKMILVAGIAVLKPAEFTLIRVEKLCR